MPTNVDRYSRDDRRRIAERMLTIELALEDGIDLEAASEPLPIEPNRIAARLNG